MNIIVTTTPSLSRRHSHLFVFEDGGSNRAERREKKVNWMKRWRSDQSTQERRDKCFRRSRRGEPKAVEQQSIGDQ